jgi:hypothetical protein
MLNEIQIGRLNGLLHKLLDMKEGAPAPTLATDVFPMLVLESDRPEWLFLSGQRMCGALRQTAATVGQYSHAGLWNPAGSGVLAVVREITIWPVAVDLYFALEKGSAKKDTAGVGVILDTRGWPDSTHYQSTVYPYSYTNAVATGFSFAFIRTLASGVPMQLTHPIVLGPGTNLLVRPSAANTAINVNFKWMERPLAPSETR